MKRDRALTDFEVAVQGAENKARSGDWIVADGKVLVGLCAVCHKMVYGLLPLELEKQQREFRAATREASRILRVHFNNDIGAMVEFVKWVWQREKGRVEWASKQSPPRERTRLGWRLSLSDSFVTDYRAYQHMHRGA